MPIATEVKERPILFSGPMVRAILDDRKTQTRRIIKPQPPEGFRSMVRDCDPKGGWWFCNMPPQRGPFSVGEFKKWDHVYPQCPYGKPGDRLWVRETWATERQFDHLAPANIHPSAHSVDRCLYGSQIVSGYHRSRPSIHMPRWASRITLEVTGVRVERLKEIVAKDVAAEGYPFSSDLDQFKLLWNDLNAKRGYGWEVDPWVWVIEFKRTQSS